MLRTAQEIIDECFEKAKTDATVKEIYIMAVNTAVEEAIRESAKSAKTKWDQGHKYIESAYVDKQSILDLIHQIK